MSVAIIVFVDTPHQPRTSNPVAPRTIRENMYRPDVSPLWAPTSVHARHMYKAIMDQIAPLVPLMHGALYPGRYLNLRGREPFVPHEPCLIPTPSMPSEHCTAIRNLRTTGSVTRQASRHSRMPAKTIPEVLASLLGFGPEAVSVFADSLT